MSEQSQTSKIYIDLESLLDLRQGMMFPLYKDKEKLANYISSEKYCFRTIDLLDTESEVLDYNEHIQEAGSNILLGANLTYCITVLNSKADGLEKRNSVMGIKSEPEIVINTYPIKLTDLACEVIRSGVFKKLINPCYITLVYMEPKELTPYFIKSNNFATCIIYNYSSWLNENLEKAREERISNCSFYFPALTKSVPTDEEKKTLEATGFKDPFGYLEFILSTVMDVSFLPTLFYSNVITATAYLHDLEKTEPEKTEKEEEIDKEVEKTVMNNIDELLKNLETEDGDISTETEGT